MNTAPLRPPGFRGPFSLADAERSKASEASGILFALPHAVAARLDAADVRALVRWSAETGSPLVPRGAGTGMPGGNVGGGTVVDLLAGFRQIIDVDADAARAVVEPGVTLAELNAACRRAQLHFPVDPSSATRCTLGGMVANNSAGAHSVRYGATRSWIDALDVVLANGSQVRVRRGEPVREPALRKILDRCDAQLFPQRDRIEESWPRVRKNSSGYALREYIRSGDALDLLIGSEGTLEVIIRVELRLAPLPFRRGVALLEFESLERAGTAVQRVLGFGPATCEMLDRTFLQLVRDAGADAGYPLRAGLEAILLVEVEGQTDAEVGQLLQRLKDGMAGVADRVSLATDPEQQERFW